MDDDFKQSRFNFGSSNPLSSSLFTGSSFSSSPFSSSLFSSTPLLRNQFKENPLSSTWMLPSYSKGGKIKFDSSKMWMDSMKRDIEQKNIKSSVNDLYKQMNNLKIDLPKQSSSSSSSSKSAFSGVGNTLLRIGGGLLQSGIECYLSSKNQSESRSHSHDKALLGHLRERNEEINALKEQNEANRKKQEEDDRRLLNLLQQQEEQKKKLTKAQADLDKQSQLSLKEYQHGLEQSLIETVEQYLNVRFSQHDFSGVKALLKGIAEAEQIVTKSQQHIEAIAKGKSLNLFTSMNHFNVVLTGKTGVGKSTVINEFLHLDEEAKAKTGGNCLPITTELSQYESPSIPSLRLWDNRGIELKNYDIVQAIKHLVELINDHAKEGKPDFLIHAVWYCVSTLSNRFEEYELKGLIQLNQLYEGNKLPIILVLTQTYNEEDGKKYKEYLRKLLPGNIEIIPVVAVEKFDMKPYGFDELLEVTARKASKATGSACYHSIKLKLKEEVNQRVVQLEQKAEVQAKQTIAKEKKGLSKEMNFSSMLNALLMNLLQSITSSLVSFKGSECSLTSNSLKLIEAIVKELIEVSQEMLKVFKDEQMDKAKKELTALYLILYKKIQHETGCALPFEESEVKWKEAALNDIEVIISESSDLNALAVIADIACTTYIKSLSALLTEELDKGMTNMAKVIEDIAQQEVANVTEKLLSMTLNSYRSQSSQ